MLEFNGTTILVVTAHPDDLEWCFGGTIYQLARANRVIHIIATAGERGGGAPGGEAEPASTRTREQWAAAEITGVRETIFFDLPDGDLAYGSLTVLRTRLYRAMRIYRPEVLITFDPENRCDPHPDHITAGRTAFEAACLHPCPAYFPDGSARADAAPPAHYLFFGSWLPEPFLVNDVTAEFPRKLEALACHKSQVGRAWERIEADLRAVAEENGARIGARYGEAYRRLARVHGVLRPTTEEAFPRANGPQARKPRSPRGGSAPPAACPDSLDGTGNFSVRRRGSGRRPRMVKPDRT
ncbi:MAG: PIG-L deacetylase family protein [Bacteroidota bacterium]